MKEKHNGNGKVKGEAVPASIKMTFEENALLPMLYGENDEHLQKIENHFHVTASSRGNVVALSGEHGAVEASRNVLQSLYDDLRKRGDLTSGEVDAAIRMVNVIDEHDPKHYKGDSISIQTMRKVVRPYSHMQASYFRSLFEKELVFALGPAGTGKTYIAVAMAVHLFMNKKVDRIILSRPAVEAGEKLGFLPGDLKEKIDPYLRPLYDALHDMIPPEKVNRYIETGEIEVAPLAFMRGRTLANSFVILDEAQNTTPTQMKMFLTRMGERSRMIVTGDLSQTDLPRDVKSGLGDAVRKLEKIDDIAVIRFGDGDVVRHKLAALIIQAYDEWDRSKKRG